MPAASNSPPSVPNATVPNAREPQNAAISSAASLCASVARPG
jgi:hypothetical protein